ncbi:MAG: ribonuclease P protein component [Oscillospiraceae bacterium]|nr:ribonuclease P protein component [Oscillospiraceae bacterium]
MDARYSIKKNSDFRHIYAKGKTCVSPYLVVYCRRNRTNVSRLGITVSAKIGNAVCRNRIRRRLREIYRLNSSLLKPGFDIIIVARTKSINAEYRMMNDAFLECCSSLELIEK